MTLVFLSPLATLRTEPPYFAFLKGEEKRRLCLNRLKRRRSLRASSPWRSGGGAGKGRRACNYVSFFSRYFRFDD